MTPGSALFSALALLPAITGPVPQLVRDGSIILGLCGGGAMAIPLHAPQAPQGDIPCCAKGCRSSEKRRRFDPAQ